MTISYFEAAAWNTAGTTSGISAYKDVTVTGAQAGDLLIAYGFGENAGTGTRTVATQSGSTGAWTLSSPTTSNNGSVSEIAGWAVVSASGTVVVRVTVNSQTPASDHMGAGVVYIPAADVGATYGWATTLSLDTDGQISVTLSASSTVIYGAGDWTATSLSANGGTPTGAVYDKRLTDGTSYALYIAHWLTQTTTANYGPSGLTGKNFTGSVFRMDTAGGGGTAATAAGVISLTASGGGQAPVAASASVGFGGSAGGKGAAAASGAVALIGTAVGSTGATGAVSVTAAGVASTGGTGAVSLSGTAVGSTGATGAVTVTAAGAATGRAGGTGAVSLSGTATGSSTGSPGGTGTLAVTGAASGAGPGVAAGAFTVTGSATASARGAASGALTVTAAAVMGIAASAAVALTAATTGRGNATTAGAVALTGTASSTYGPVTASGTITLTAVAFAGQIVIPPEIRTLTGRGQHQLTAPPGYMLTGGERHQLTGPPARTLTGGTTRTLT